VLVEVYLCLPRDIPITDLDMDRMDVQGHDIFMLFAVHHQPIQYHGIIYRTEWGQERVLQWDHASLPFATFISNFSTNFALRMRCFNVHSALLRALYTS